MKPFNAAAIIIIFLLLNVMPVKAQEVTEYDLKVQESISKVLKAFDERGYAGEIILISAFFP